jgi:uncharacterized protein YceK
MKTRLIKVMACVVLLCGCASQVKLDASKGNDESSKQSKQENKQSGTSGRDTNQTLINLFSNLNYQGGSAWLYIACTATAFLIMKLRTRASRKERAFMLLVQAIEKSQSQGVKQTVLHDALEQGLADLIHSKTRKLNPKETRCEKN